jgi:MYXO-CTERM domain-containing protein
MRRALGLLLLLSLSATPPALAIPPHKQKITGYVVPKGVATRPVPAANVIHLTLLLQPRDPQGLAQFAFDVANPKSAGFHHFLSASDMTARFGASDADYQGLLKWAAANHLTVEEKFPHRLALSVSGKAADLERALAVKFSLAKRPDGSEFHRPDRAPSLDVEAKIATVAGIDNFYVAPHRGGSQLGGSAFGAPDLRNAFAAGCLGLTGAGETVGIFSLSGYEHVDVASYEAAVGLPSSTAAGCGASTATSAPCLSDVMAGGFGGAVTSTGAEDEVTADVEMAIAMAPGLKQVKVFEGDPTQGCAAGDAIIAEMAAATDVKQFSSSFGFCVSDDITLLQMMAGAGQSFFVPSGDYGGGYSTTNSPNFNVWLQTPATVAGGTVLAMNGAGVSYSLEQAWKFSGGGIENLPALTTTCTPGCTPGATGCSNNCLPSWQAGIVTALNGASSTYRNDPDVAMPAQNLFVHLRGGPGTYCGTSVAAPLWAGFLALVNQQKCANNPSNCAAGQGFLNPVIYDIGRDATVYPTSFHDVTAASSDGICGFSGQSLNPSATYDLATGWGSPTCGLVAQLTCTTCSGMTPAPGTAPSASCVSFESDPHNCGTCGNVCSGVTTCIGGVCRAGSSSGDTHVTTLDGLFYDFQAAGDFLLITTNPSFVVQARQASGAPNWPNAATNHAIAVQMGQSRVAFFLDPARLVVDKKVTLLDDGQSLSLTGGVTVARSGDTYTVTRINGETVRVVLHDSWIDAGVGLGYSPHGTARGLLGDGNGRTSDDIATRDGKALPQPVSFEDLYHRFAESMRIDPRDSLFGDEKPITYAVPAQPFYANDVDLPKYTAARAECDKAGVRGDALLDACTLDVVVLGTPKAATAFVGSQAPVAVMQPGSGPRKPPAGCSAGCGIAVASDGRFAPLVLAILGMLLLRRRIIPG